MSMCEKIIYKQNLLNNVNVLKKHCKNSKLCAVVKANAYGFGFENIIPIIKNKVDYFAVATCYEALKVRCLTNKPILILGEIVKESILEAIKNNISLSVSSYKKLNQINKIAKENNMVAKIHFKVNTGMNRLGFSSINTFKNAFNKFYFSKNLKYEGIFSHIFNCNCYIDTIKQQMIFEQYLQSVDTQNLIKHIACTEVLLKYPQLKYDMCRVGIGLYNYAKVNCYGLKSILEIKSKIINIINVKKGKTVGYGSNFMCNKNTRVAVIAIGYADGFSRMFSNNGKVLIQGQFCNIIGNICMDMCFVDCTSLNVKVGDFATIVGYNGNKNINAIDLANKINTIDYEILTNFKNDRMNVKIL